MRKRLSSYDWDNMMMMMRERNCLESWMLFMDLINEGTHACIPKGFYQLSKTGRALWMNESALIKVKKKTAGYKRYLETRKVQTMHCMQELETKLDGPVEVQKI